jgi:hypothetical protein
VKGQIAVIEIIVYTGAALSTATGLFLVWRWFSQFGDSFSMKELDDDREKSG